MPAQDSAIALQSFTTFGALLRFLRRRARLTQNDLGIAAGYSVAHINRFEKDKHLPDPATVASLFIPALDLAHEPALAARLMELVSNPPRSESMSIEFPNESIPPAPPREIIRAQLMTLAHKRLQDERHLVVCGQPGVGKTTLVSALAREFAKTMPVFWLTITEGMTTSADAWVHRIAEFLLAQGQTQVKPLVPSGPDARPRFSLDQKIRLLSSALTSQPVLLCFDNAEVIRNEEACLQLLRHLCETTPAYLLFASRHSLPLARVAEMTLEGFEGEEAIAFIESNLDYALDEKQATRLIVQVDGNPMLLRLATGQLTTQAMDAETFIAHLETQPQVSNYLLQTLQVQSSPQSWRLLLLLAVFQQPLDLYDAYLAELIQSLGGIENLGQAIGELQSRRLISDATCARLHPFIREYIYLTLNTQTNLRQKLHRLAGEWVAHTTQDVIVAAHHYNRAGLPDLALEQIEKNYSTIRAQGQVLVAVTILDESQAQTRRMHSAQNDLLRRLLIMRGRLLVGTLRAAEGEANLREAIELSGAPAVRAWAVIELARIISQRRDNVQALRLAQTMREELAPQDLLLRIRLFQIESHTNRDAGNLDESDRKQMEVLALADQMASISPMMSDDIRADAHYQLSVNARARHHIPVAMKHARIGLELATSARLANTIRLFQNQLGWLSFGDGDMDMAFRYFKESSDGLIAIGDVHSNAYVLVNLANIQHIRGQDDQALEQIARATETLRIIGDMAGLANAEETRTDCLLWLGKIKEARLAREQFIQEAEGKGPTRLWGYCLMKLAIIQLVQNETDAAIETIQCALALPATQSNRMMLFALRNTLAVALLVVGDLAAVDRTLADAPRFDGLERFAVIDRMLIDGYVALAHGDSVTAQKCADQVLQTAGQYDLYHQGAHQLGNAIQRAASASEFPRSLWVKRELE
jgi:ATP/maltotriose-dependent transcriptional regulator MalT